MDIWQIVLLVAIGFTIAGCMLGLLPLFPSWKTVSSKQVELEMVSPIFKKEWKEDAVLIIQESRYGKKRAYIVRVGKKEPVDIDFVKAFLDVEPT